VPVGAQADKPAAVNLKCVRVCTQSEESRVSSLAGTPVTMTIASCDEPKQPATMQNEGEDDVDSSFEMSWKCFGRTQTQRLILIVYKAND
jgi:hypothetical protein